MSVRQFLDRLIDEVPEGAFLGGVQIGEKCLFDLRHELRQHALSLGVEERDLKGDDWPIAYRGVPLEVFRGDGQGNRLNPVYVPDCAFTGTDKEWRR